MLDASTGWYVVPATVKAVVVSPDRRVLLARNKRDEWELPGGWPTREDETVADVIRREVSEEAAIEVEVGPLLHAELANVGGHHVVIVIYGCSSAVPQDARPGDEHGALKWATHAETADLDLIAPYVTAIELAFRDHA